MKVSESITNNLFFEIDSLISRVRNIKQCFKNTSNTGLRKRLAYENNTLIERIREIDKVANYLSKKSKEKISISSVLLEKSRRILNEIRAEKNLFFL